MRYSIFLLSICLFFSSVSVSAQAPSSETKIGADELEELIKTLESETARKEFIADLKTLIEVKKGQDSESQTSLTASFALEEIQDLKDWYGNLLQQFGLNESLFGKSIASAITVIITFLLLFLVRKSSLLLNKKFLMLKEKYSLSHYRFFLYVRCVRYAGYALCLFLAFYLFSLTWNIADFGSLWDVVNLNIFGTLINVVLTLVLVLSLWEIANTFIEHGMRKAGSSQSNRLRTLLPIVRNILLIFMSILFLLVMLSEVGIDILPLLAGAGIVGIAVGFGAQTMVKDFLTGFVIILEDLVQVGDVAGVGGKTGLVEKITLRKIQLRDLSGTVYTVPYSEITIVENLTKEFSYYLMNVGVAYRENPDEVIQYLKEISESMSTDDRYKNLILEPIEILGVDQFADSAVIIKARIKTLPIKQWEVGREFNRRMKHKFDEKNIEIPFPHQTVYFGQDKQGLAPPLRVFTESEPADDQSAEKS